MNKKLNTALFFTVATVINVLVVFVIGLGLFIPWAFLLGRQVNAGVNSIALLVCIMAGLGISFPAYKWLVVWFSKKVDVDKYFENSVKLLVRKSSPRDKFGQK